MGWYDFAVTQQKPYLTGYSMNMAQGLSITMSDNIVLSDGLEITNIISSTGLAYGMATWYRAQMEIKDPIIISKIYAGVSLLDDENYIPNIIEENGYFPNKIPEACGIHTADDENYPTEIHVDTLKNLAKLTRVSHVEGFTACDNSDDVINMLDLFLETSESSSHSGLASLVSRRFPKKKTCFFAKRTIFPNKK